MIVWPQTFYAVDVQRRQWMIMVDAGARVVQQRKWEALPTGTRGSTDEWNAGRTSEFVQIEKRRIDNS